MANDIVVMSDKVTAKKNGLVIKGDFTFKEWEEVGKKLNTIEGAVHWWIGDWLNYGERAYGEMYAQAVEETGYDNGTLRNDKYVSSRIELSRRHDNLSFGHHQTVASLEPTEQDKFLSLAVKLDMPRSVLRAEVYKYNHLLKTPSMPNGKYKTIYADPPWPVGSIVMDKWESPISDKYPTMEVEEIAALGVPELADDDCSLFLWTTHTFLPDAIKIIAIWGFKYFCCITWDKGGGWTQNGFHKRTELLLFAYKGNINIEQHGKAIPTLIEEAKGKHSKKPDSIRDLITSKTPAPRLEMFARDSYPEWTAWGNEV